jgi:hypothetical protein
MLCMVVLDRMTSSGQVMTFTCLIFSLRKKSRPCKIAVCVCVRARVHMCARACVHARALPPYAHPTFQVLNHLTCFTEIGNECYDIGDPTNLNDRCYSQY